MRVRMLAVVLVLGVSCAATVATAARSRRVRDESTVTYRIAFTGSGRATSAYPAAASDATVFTTAIQWSLVFTASIDLPLGGGSSLPPKAGSTLQGVSNGVVAAGGEPIQEGCEQITLGLDDSQPGASIAASTPPTAALTLTVPGFADGALLTYSPSQCDSPFPTGQGGSGCPDPTAYSSPTVKLDTRQAKQTFTLSGRCDIPKQGQTASWTGTVTATRTSGPPGVTFAGLTSQYAAITFEVDGRRIVHLRTQDAGSCNMNRHSHDGVTPPPGTLAQNGTFRLHYTAVHGAYSATVTGKIAGKSASGTVSSAERFDVKSGALDPHGTVVCKTAGVTWTAHRLG